ncbi:hypothetical protein FZC73_23160, partial [Enterobacter hormaechei]
MKIIDNSLLIDVALTEEVYEQVKLLLTGLDDISLKIESSVISAKVIDLPIAVSSVFFKNCTFVVSTVISNLKDGRFFKIENCKRDFFLGNVKIKGVNCRNLVIDQDEIENFAERLSPDIE